MEVEIL